LDDAPNFERTIMIEFEGAVPALAKALNKRGYTELTPVQNAVLAPELADVDMLVSAQTGSGKTVAFGLSIAPTLLGENEQFRRAHEPVALVVAPTRELALQVKRELDWLYGETGAVITSCVGGMDIRTERRALERGVHIVVGTPGRLRDHISRNALVVNRLKAVVLDEADEMLDLGFKEDLEFILESTPEERRTLLFSATVPPMIGKLAKQYQNDAVRVTTKQEKEQHVDIEYRALMTAPREKENAIINVLRYYEAKNALVFCNTRATVNHMTSRFNNRGFSVVALSGELTQNERTHALQAMRDGRARVCIATDVAARGIDLPNLELVVHAELPSNPETLLHRSGRTGRAGRKGVSALMVDHKTRGKAERILRFAKVTADWASPPTADDVLQRDEERMMEDPILTDPIEAEEKEAAERLLADFTAEQIAAAFLRLSKAGRSAPEDIQSVPVSAPVKGKFADRGERQERAPREDFKNSVWVSLSVGRKQNAEPRWLIPLICNAGGITKREIGVIKMQNDETYVQLNADESAAFFDDLGPNQTLEKNIRVQRLDGKPVFKDEPFEKKPHRKGKFDKPRGDKKFGGKKFGGDKPYKDKPNDETFIGNKPMKGKPDDGKPGGGKKGKKKKPSWTAEQRAARDAAKAAEGDKPAFKQGWAKKKPKAASGKPARNAKPNSKGGKAKPNKGGMAPLKRKKPTPKSHS
jgi:ATP-dependent RNA helicase DeaD